MNKRKVRLLCSLLIVILLVSAVIYVIGRLGFIGEAAMMLILLPLMLGAICLTCWIYVEASDEKRDH